MSVVGDPAKRRALGLDPDALTAVITPRVAMELLLTAAPISAQRAFEVGLVGLPAIEPIDNHQRNAVPGLGQGPHPISVANRWIEAYNAKDYETLGMMSDDLHMVHDDRGVELHGPEAALGNMRQFDEMLSTKRFHSTCRQFTDDERVADVRGRSGVMRLLRNSAEGVFPDRRFETDWGRLVDGARVAVERTWVATAARDAPGFASKGQPCGWIYARSLPFTKDRSSTTWSTDRWRR